MAVAVSTEGGKGQLITNADRPVVLLDGKPTGEANPDGITLENLGTTDHDLQVTEDKDRQRFVLTYTSTPALTVYVKSDPNAGTLIVMTGQDGVEAQVDALQDHERRRHIGVADHRVGGIEEVPEGLGGVLR